jgi:magnesium transporter
VLMTVSVIAGIYGMNFKFMPELEWEHGYAFAIALMGSVAVAILLYFRAKRWI